MLVVGLTGNIAAGKSTVSRAFVARGATLIDSDAAARAAVEPGSPTIERIAHVFGAGVLSADGTLDRSLLGRRVFGDREARRTLERIMHPAIEASRQAALAHARERGDMIVVCDIPLLFEARLAYQFARIVLVDAPAPVRIARLMRDRLMHADDAAARVRAQMPSVLKRARVDIVIDNDADHDALTSQVAATWLRLQEWAAVAAPHAST